MATQLSVIKAGLVGNAVITLHEAVMVVSLDLFAASGVLSRDDRHLVLTYDDGSVIYLEDFFLVHNRGNLPDFNIEGTEISGEDFFAALDATEIMPATGGQQGSLLGGGSTLYEIASGLNPELAASLEALETVRFDGSSKETYDSVSSISSAITHGRLQDHSLEKGERIEGGAGDDVISVSTVSGGEIYGHAGDDEIRVEGGTGAYIDGGEGADRIFGGSGNDVIVYDSNDTVVSGGDGLDILLVKDGQTVGNIHGFEAVITGIDSEISAEFLVSRGISVEDNKIILDSGDHGEWKADGASFVYTGHDATTFQLSAEMLDVVIENG